jgi:hypothetical protein
MFGCDLWQLSGSGVTLTNRPFQVERIYFKYIVYNANVTYCPDSDRAGRLKDRWSLDSLLRSSMRRNVF